MGRFVLEKREEVLFTEVIIHNLIQWTLSYWYKNSFTLFDSDNTYTIYRVKFRPGPYPQVDQRRDHTMPA